MYRSITRSVRLVAVPLLLAGVAAGVFPVTAAAARAGSPGRAASFTINGGLAGVAATSATNAWAVGYSGSLLNPKALIVRWNGTAWTPVANPAPAGSILSGVAATSATNAWAVGSTGSGKSLIERWNGNAWKQVSSPSPGGGAGLSGVAATSATNAWAVGSYSTSTGANPLILRWNGAAWKQMPGLSLAGGGDLAGVTAASDGSAWAVGSTGSSSTQTLIVRWNGAAWTRVPSPSPGGVGNPDVLRGVAAVSASSALAVGCTTCATASGFNKPLIEGWNGKVWAPVPGPALGGLGGILSGVAATSTTNAWAVGGTETGVGINGTFTTLILRWNGAAWKRALSPSPGTRPGLAGVTATSATNAWAVGDSVSKTNTSKTLILHWTGAAWKVS